VYALYGRIVEPYGSAEAWGVATHAPQITYSSMLECPFSVISARVLTDYQPPRKEVIELRTVMFGQTAGTEYREEKQLEDLDDLLTDLLQENVEMSDAEQDYLSDLRSTLASPTAYADSGSVIVRLMREEVVSLLDLLIHKTPALHLPPYQPAFDFDKVATVGEPSLVFYQDLELSDVCEVPDDHIFPIECSDEFIESYVTDRDIFPIDVPDEVIKKGYPTKLNEIGILPLYLLESTHVH